MNKSILLAEPGVYGPVFQGEGAMLGLPTLFVRCAGCDYRCSWCDSMYAVDPQKFKHEWKKYSTSDILQQVRELGYPGCWVTLSGGNPALQDLSELVSALQSAGFPVAVETQGTVLPKWFDNVDHIAVSPKPPSSGHNTDPERWAQVVGQMQRLHQRRPIFDEHPDVPSMCVKVVVFTELDFSFADFVLSNMLALPGVVTVVQAGTDRANPTADAIVAGTKRVEAMVAEARRPYRVIPQLHAIIHGDRRDV